MEMLGRAQRAAVFKERTTMIATGEHTDEARARRERAAAKHAARMRALRGPRTKGNNWGFSV